MYFIRHSFTYITPAGHRQRIGSGKYERLPDAAIQAARECGALGDQAERAPENKVQTRAPRRKRKA